MLFNYLEIYVKRRKIDARSEISLNILDQTIIASSKDDKLPADIRTIYSSKSAQMVQSAKRNATLDNILKSRRTQETARLEDRQSLTVGLSLLSNRSKTPPPKFQIDSVNALPLN